jgi:hypothetical protein
MHSTWRRRLTAAAAVLLLALTACAEAGSLVTTAPAATADAAMDDMGTMDEHMDDMDHDHEHAAEGREWDSGDVPTISVTVTGDAESGWDVVADVPGFEFTVGAEHVPGQGHGHLVVDGEVLSMIFAPEFHIDELAPGMHEIAVTLAANDHVDFVAGGELVGGSTMVEVAGTVEAADVTVEVTYLAGEVSASNDRVEVSVGDVVEVTVTSDVSEELHVHGYDLSRSLAPGEASVLRFEVDFPGIFEVELEDSGELLFELEVS